MSDVSDDVDDFDELINCYSSASTKNAFKRTIHILKSEKAPVVNAAKKVQVFPEVPINSRTSDKVQECFETSTPVVEESPPSSDERVATAPKGVEADSHVASIEAEADPCVAQKVSKRMLPLFDEIGDEVLLSLPDKLLDNTQAQLSLDSSLAKDRSNKVVDLCCDEDEPTEVPARRYNTRRSKGSVPQSVIPVKRVTKKRGKKAQAKPADDEVMILDAVIDGAKNQSVEEDDCNYEVNVKILWKSVNVVKIPVRRMQKLKVVFEHFMKLENVPQEQVMLTFQNKAVKPNDTPDSLNLNVWDFIDGGVLNSAVESCVDTPKGRGPGFSLKFQDIDKKTIVLPAEANEKMKIVMTRYSEQVDKPLENIQFMFDGSLIKHSDTPASLDIDSGDVIDVIYSK